MRPIERKDEKRRAIEAMIASGRGVCESCREVGVSEKTYYRWRRQRAAAKGNPS